MAMQFPETVVQGEFSPVLQSAVTRCVTDYSVFVRRRGQILWDRFFYIEQGVFHIEETGGSSLCFSAGDIVYLPGDVTYRSQWEKEPEGRYTSVNFSLTDREGARFSLGENIALLTRDRHQEFFSLFRELSRKWERGSFGYRLECTSLLYAVMYRASLCGMDAGERGERRGMDKAILYLENNYLSDISTSALAEIAGVGECMFRRSFQRIMNTSPVQYRNRLRLAKAREMLCSGEYTVLEATMAAGFDDPGYFSRLFKREFGISPSDFIP